jgi:hypothetical protein
MGTGGEGKRLKKYFLNLERERENMTEMVTVRWMGR